MQIIPQIVKCSTWNIGQVREGLRVWKECISGTIAEKGNFFGSLRTFQPMLIVRNKTRTTVPAGQPMLASPCVEGRLLHLRFGTVSELTQITVKESQ